jgi:hypothetical protein
MQHLTAELAEGVVDHCAGGLGGIALPPIRYAQPTADLGLLALPAGNAAAADEGTLPRDDEERLAVLAGSAETAPRLGKGVGMRNAERAFRDAAVVGERRDRCGIVAAGEDAAPAAASKARG